MSYEFCPNHWGLLASQLHLVLQLVLGTMRTSVQSELWVPGGSPGWAPEPIFLSLFCICCVKTVTGNFLPSALVEASCGPGPTAPSEQATKWRLVAGLWLPTVGSRVRHLSPSSPTPPSQAQWPRAGILRGLSVHSCSLGTPLCLYWVEDHKPLVDFLVILISLKCWFSDGSFPCKKVRNQLLMLLSSVGTLLAKSLGARVTDSVKSSLYKLLWT